MKSLLLAASGPQQEYNSFTGGHLDMWEEFRSPNIMGVHLSTLFLGVVEKCYIHHIIECQ